MDHRFWAEWDRSWLKLADTAVKIKNTAFMYDFTGIHAMNLQPVFANYSEFTSHQRSRRVHHRDTRYPPNQQYDVRLFYVMTLVWAWPHVPLYENLEYARPPVSEAKCPDRPARLPKRVFAGDLAWLIRQHAWKREKLC